MRAQIKSIFVNLLVERPARRRGYTTIIAALAKHQQEFPAFLRKRGESDANRSKLRHVIGIERWGQNRLRVALGQDYVRDDYHGYKPDKTLSWEDLIERYAKTRATTLELAQQLQTTELADEVTVEHNQWGPLTARGWLHYLETHARLEGKRIKSS